VLTTLKKSRRLYAIALSRLHDYKELARIEMKLQGRSVGVQLLSYALIGVFGFLAVVFLGVAIIVSAWDTSYRTEAAWLVVLLYAAVAAGAFYFVRHFHGESALTTLRSELRRDMDTLKESL
jgi:uncharacterized membrane protein YqjE